LTKASLYVYFGPVGDLVCRRFDHTPSNKYGIFNLRKNTLIRQNIEIKKYILNALTNERTYTSLITGIIDAGKQLKRLKSK